MMLIEFAPSSVNGGTADRVIIVTFGNDVDTQAAIVLRALRSRGIATGSTGLDATNAEITQFTSTDALISHARRRAPYAAIVDLTSDETLSKRLHHNLFESIRDGGVHATLLEASDEKPRGVLARLRGEQPGIRPEWVSTLIAPPLPGKADRKSNALRRAIADATDTSGLVLLGKTGTHIEYSQPNTPSGSFNGTSTEIDLEVVWRVSGIRGLPADITSVEVSNDGSTWLAIPVRPLDGTHRFDREIRTRYLRAQTTDLGWSALARHWDVRPRLDAKFISSRRPDGLGGRLAALLNAIRLSRLLGLDYRFRWGDNLVNDEHHAVPSADKVFAPEYWRVHGDTERPIEQQPSIKATSAALGRAHTLDEVRNNLTSANGFTVPLEPIGRYVDAPGIDAPYAAEFAEIGFSAEIEASLKVARTVELPANAVGLHLRSGDIVFGKYRRYFVHTRKVISFPIAKAVIGELERRGHTVILFGQDEALAADLVSGSRTIKAADLLDGGSPTQQALAEIVLLSRLDMVVARNSLFAEQAASISGTPLIDPIEFFAPLEQVRITDAELENSTQHPLSIAFAYWSAYYVSRHEIESPEAVRLLTLAQGADPENPLYPIAIAAHLFAAGRLDEAEAVLNVALTTDFPPNLGTVDSTFCLRMGDWYLLDEYFPAFDAAAAAGSALAAQFIATRNAEVH